MLVAPYFRRYDLPWAPHDEAERRYRRLVRILLIVTTLLALVLWLLPERERPIAKPSDLPERVVQLIVEKPKPPPPPTPEKKPEEPKPEPKPQVARDDRPVKPRPQVKDQGLLAMKDELAELRDQLDPNQLASPELKTPGPDSRSERSLITSKVGAASGGINTATLSRGFGGGAGSIGTHTTTSVSVDRSRVGGDGRGVAKGGSGKNSRPREEVEIVFDRNKGALYALYGRALRDAPELKGKLVLEFTIAASGEITMCRVVSSELNDAELERKIVARVRLIRFQSMDVAPLTVTKPIDFFPA